ncbi:MAG: hypothetical protein ACI4UJ_09695, partial [Candidatus Cryptobacteroides sp.]
MARIKFKDADSKSSSQPENHRPHLPRSHSPVGGLSAHGSDFLPEPSTNISQPPLIINHLLIYTVDGDFRVT